MKLSEWRRQATLKLAAGGDEDARTDARLFLCAALGIDLQSLSLHLDEKLSVAQEKTLDAMLARRLDGEPEQYIEGAAWFMGLKFKCDARALIPRQDTETLCELALKYIDENRPRRALDLCTGSGILAVTLKKLRPKLNVTASDISPAALELARENAVFHGTEIEFILSDGFKKLKPGSFDLIVCNPPYLSEADMREISREVQREPQSALYGGEDGLELYRRFARELASSLSPGGCAMFEVGQGQAEQVGKILKDNLNESEITAHRDLNGIKRVVSVRKI